jgi:thioredoxin-dependent peroxiredoxin
MVTLQEGDKVPAFSGTDEQGNKISSASLKGKRYILYFYPQDATPTCTVQACNLRDNFAALRKAGWEIIGISPDTAQQHGKFITKHKLPFPLIADTDQKMLKQFGVWDKKKLFGHEYMGVLRTTFLVDEKGVIRKIFLKPRSADHAGEILRSLK